VNGAGNARTERFETIGLYMPAVPTPFAENGDVDVPALESFCDRQIWLGASALVVCGTTGEAPTLTRAEHDQIVRIAGDVARGRKRQSGGTSTAVSLSLLRPLSPLRSCFHRIWTGAA